VAERRPGSHEGL